MSKIHYCYKITNLNPTDNRLYYIGVRTTTKASPEMDINYRSSSTHLKCAINEIGHTNFSKEILSVWVTRELAVLEEIRLHNKYDVARNKEFYNKTKQTVTGFDSEGLVTVISKTSGNYIKIYVDEFDNEFHKYISEGFVNVIDTKHNIRLKVTKKEFDKHPHYVGCTINQVTVLDKRDNKTKNVSQDDYYLFDYYESITKNKIIIFDLVTNTKKKVPTSEFHNNPNYININAVKISIFDDTDKLVDVSYGDFKNLCISKSYPSNAFKISYQKNGQRLYMSTNGKTKDKLALNGNLMYTGWYAIKEALR